MNNNIRFALNTTRAAVNAFNDYRERKAAEAYDALSEVAENYTIAELAELGQEKGKALLGDSRDSAAKVTENARLRLELARSEAEAASAAAATAGAAKFADIRKTSSKKGKELAKKADKKAIQLGVKEAPKKKRKGGMIALVITVLGVLGTAAYWFLYRSEKAETVPPRVEEHTAEGSRLVYSTVTPTTTEVDSEFLEELDKQLAEHKLAADEVEEQVQAITPQPINDGEFANEAIDEALTDADVAELDSLADQADEAEKKFDK